MNKSEYPFDNSGQYRRDWVKSGSTARTSSSSLPPKPEVNSYGARGSASAPPSSNTTFSPPPTIVPPATTSPSIATYHTVKSGDTLYGIGRRYGKSVPDLKRINGLSSDMIRLGQTLRIP